MSSLPSQVRQVTDLFLSLADEAMPGLVEGLYLRGSLGFGEWYDDRSDIDYVAVLSDRPDGRRSPASARCTTRSARPLRGRRSTGST